MKIKVDTKDIDKLVQRAEKEAVDLNYDALAFFKKTTPYRKGGARRNTRLQNGDTIVANYPYAARLDEGYSKQAPDGMVAPTEEYIEKVLIPAAVRRITRG